jgi:DNA repair exonuclease SbcCD ATPase subunit
MDSPFQVTASPTGPDLASLASGSAFESVANHLGRFIQIGRALESRLVMSEERVRHLERELKEAHTLFDRMMKDEKAKNTDAALELAKVKSQLQAQREAEQLLKMQFSSVGAELQKRSAELKQFQERWSQILQREAEAKTILAKNEQTISRIQELERRLSEAEKTIADERELRRKAREQTVAYRSELEHAVKTVDTLLAARASSKAQARVAPGPVDEAAPKRQDVQRQQSKSASVSIQPGMSWMSPRASHDDNPSKLFETELESWREAAPSQVP